MGLIVILSSFKFGPILTSSHITECEKECTMKLAVAMSLGRDLGLVVSICALLAKFNIIFCHPM